MLNRRPSLFAVAEVNDDIRVDRCVDVAHLRCGVPEEAIEPAWMAPPPRNPRSKETIALALGQQECAVVREPSSGGRKRRGCDRRVVGVEWNVVIVRTFATRVTPQTFGIHFAEEEIEGARSETLGGWCDRQRSRGESCWKDRRIKNALAVHFGVGRLFDRNLAAGELRPLKIGNTLFNGATDCRRFAHR